MFDEPTKLALGLLTGIVFGFLLQKGRAAKFHVIIGQFLLKDWTVVKIMGTAVIVGTVGVYALVAMDLASLQIKPMLLGGVLLGALCFGSCRRNQRRALPTTARPTTHGQGDVPVSCGSVISPISPRLLMTG